PFYSATSNRDIEVVKLLLDKGGDITAATEDGYTPLYSASNKGHLEVVKLLLNKGADITVPNSNR
ncbi:ankyrin repeat-containing domain protein, partial [Lasiosphaeria hispida]